MSIHALAAQGQQERLVELLSNRAVDVNLRDNDQRTALHWAAFTGKADAVLALLRFGSDVNALDSRSVSPLMVAALNSHLPIAQILLQHGARTDIRSLQGRTAESVATMPEIVALLRRANSANSANSSAPGTSAIAASKPLSVPPNKVPPSSSALAASPVVRPRVAVAMATSPSAAPPPAVPVRKASIGPAPMLLGGAAAASNVSTSTSSSSPSTDDEKLHMRAQIADLSDRLAKANAQIASLLERLALERATNARLHDRVRELGGGGGISTSPRDAAAGAATSSSPPKVHVSPPLVQPRVRAIPRARSISPPAPGVRAAPTDRSSPPTPVRAQPTRTDAPPPTAARGPLIQAVPARSSTGVAAEPPRIGSGVFEPPRGTSGVFEPLRGSSGVFEGMMDEECNALPPPDVSQYGSISKLTVDYGVVPAGGAGAGGGGGGPTYGSLPLPAPTQGDATYIAAHEHFDW